MSFLRIPLFAFFILTLGISCKKEKNTPVEVVPSAIPVDTSQFACRSIPDGPQPFGWRDSTTDENKNINTFMFNPANTDMLIYVVNGDMFGYNKMYSYHIPTRTATYLASVSDFIPKINRKGWILYSSADNDIYKIKATGDSAQQLTYLKRFQDPCWDNTDTCFYLFEKPYNNLKPRLSKFTNHGYPLLNYDVEMPYTCAFKKTNKIIYLHTNINNISLVIKDFTNGGSEKVLLTIPYSPISGKPYFKHLCTDQNDENAYWSTDEGIVKCQLSSGKVDTVLKNCPNTKFDKPIFQSSKPNSMLVTCHVVKNINAFQLLHTYKAVEYNLLTKEKTEIKIFP
jgi:hypothetical protein